MHETAYECIVQSYAYATKACTRAQPKTVGVGDSGANNKQEVSVVQKESVTIHLNPTVLGYPFCVTSARRPVCGLRQ